MSKLYLPGSEKDEENDTDKKSKLHEVISRINTIIPNAVLILSLLIVPFGAAVTYLYQWGTANYYKLPVEYFIESNQISKWLSYTLISLLFSFLLLLLAFKSSEKAILNKNYHPSKLLLGLLVIAALYFFFPNLQYFAVFIFIIYCIFIYLFVCYGHLFQIDVINLQKRRKLFKIINWLKNKRFFKKINNFLIGKCKKIVERKEKKAQVRSKNLFILTVIWGVSLWIALICVVFYILGYVNAAVNKSFKFIIDKDDTKFEPGTEYDMIVSETPDCYYVLKCLIRETNKSTNLSKSYRLTIYNDVVTVLKKPDELSQIEYTFDSVELKSRFSEQTSAN